MGHRPAEQQDALGRADVAVGTGERAQGVAHGLERREAHAAGDSEHHAVGRPAVSADRERDQRQDELRRLLDDADEQRGKDVEAAERVVLEQARRRHADHATRHEARDERPHGHRGGQEVAYERDEADRHRERPEHDHGRQQPWVARDRLGEHGDPAERERAREDRRPRRHPRHSSSPRRIASATAAARSETPSFS